MSFPTSPLPHRNGASKSTPRICRSFDSPLRLRGGSIPLPPHSGSFSVYLQTEGWESVDFPPFFLLLLSFFLLLLKTHAPQWVLFIRTGRKDLTPEDRGKALMQDALFDNAKAVTPGCEEKVRRRGEKKVGRTIVPKEKGTVSRYRDANAFDQLAC